MFLRRSAFFASRRLTRPPPTVSRSFSAAIARRNAADHKPSEHHDDHGHGHTAKGVEMDTPSSLTPFEEVRDETHLLPPGAPVGTIPTDYNQSTGLERLEILGKMQGVDIFDMRPLDSSRTGTMEDPIVVKSAGDEQYCGCTGCPADSHVVLWLTLSRARPLERCTECGSVYMMEYVGPPDDPHDHEHHQPEGAHPYEGEPKTFADYIKPEYLYK
ncbi:Cytochrome c oxidase subunit 4 [Thelotrema lepadinum]|nr:Cytochrome c oxidase subunit 4 [Thelotrema lepadinum]